jgi:DNA-binding NtrC family response regulator
MFSDTLFGHRKGAFTGAGDNREGMVSVAAGGTLFLDEIGDVSPGSQVKLLRLLQEGEYYPLGSDRPQRSCARIVVATNQNLESEMAAGGFRKDLYYRLCAHQVRIPPLRERKEDIPLLLEAFLQEAADSLRKQKPAYRPELLSCLVPYHFPGNVRELKAMIFDAMTRHTGGTLSPELFRNAITRKSPTGERQAAFAPSAGDFAVTGRFPTLKEMEDHLIAEALQMAGGNQGSAAMLLGITRQALNKRLCRK